MISRIGYTLRTSTSAKVVAAAFVGALVATPLAAIATKLVSRETTNKAVSAVVGAGVMTKFPDGFRPNSAATRGTLALALHRAIPRLGVQPDLDSLAASSAFTDIGGVRMRIDGASHKVQGVLLSVQIQLDHDNALGSNCNASFQITRDADPTVLGSWSQELYLGPATGEEDNIAFSIFTTQATNTTDRYHLLAANSCTQTLFTDLDMYTAQSFPFAGNGAALKAAAARVDVTTPRHDR
jgi:S-layer homology domain